MDYIRSETEQRRRRGGGGGDRAMAKSEKMSEEAGGIISQKATNIPCLVPDSIASLLPRHRQWPARQLDHSVPFTYICTYIICIVRSYLVSMWKSHQNFFLTERKSELS